MVNIYLQMLNYTYLKPDTPFTSGKAASITFVEANAVTWTIATKDATIPNFCTRNQSFSLTQALPEPSLIGLLTPGFAVLAARCRRR